MNTLHIRNLNDQFRKMPMFGQNGRFFITPGIAALPPKTQAAILGRVMGFDAFSDDDDPHGEHDFGSFTEDGHKVFWKIDYYAPDLKAGSPDPSDPKVTARVLTTMLAEEY